MLSLPTRYGAAVAFLALLGCGDSTTAPPPECDGGVTATVSAGDVPRISWAPACLVSHVLVARLDPQEGSTTDLVATPVWDVRATTNIIAPVVQYGVAPPGTIVQVAATALSAGVQHRVILLWWGPNRSLRMVANQNFWP